MEKVKGLSKTVKIIIGVVIIAAVACAASLITIAASGNEITKAEAEAIALDRVAGATSDDITKSREDKDGRSKEYDIEIVYGGYEYDFEISARTGEILDVDKEKVPATDKNGGSSSSNTSKSGGSGSSSNSGGTTSDDGGSTSNSNNNDSSNSSDKGGSTENENSDIGMEKAKSIALGNVSGATAASITEAERDYDDGRLEYEITIRYDGYEYEFTISGTSGKILEKSVEYDDDDDDYDDDDDDDDWDD